MCEAILQFGHVTKNVIEHIVLIICLAIQLYKECLKIFPMILQTDYASHALNFILEILRNSEIIDIRAFVVTQIEPNKKKVEEEVKVAYEILTKTGSMEAQEYLSQALSKREGREDKTHKSMCRNSLITCTIFFVSIMTSEVDYEEHLPLVSILEAFTGIAKQELIRPIFQASMTIERIIARCGPELTEEWEEIFNFIKEFMSNEEIKGNKDRCGYIIKIMLLIRALYISERFRGNKEALMKTYTLTSNAINDPIFDSIYLNYLIEMEVLEKLEGKLTDLFNMILNAKSNAEIASRDKRITSVFNTLKDLYERVDNIDKKSLLEDSILTRSNGWFTINISTEAKLKVIQLLQSIALQTISCSTFYSVIQKLSATFYQMQDDFHIVNLTTSERRQTSMVPGEKSSIGFEAHCALFLLFQTFYLDFPPTRLMNVLGAFINSLKSSNETTKLLTLNFLSELAYNKNYCLYLKKWNIASHLTVTQTANCVFEPMRIINPVTETIMIEKSDTLVIAAIDVLISIVLTPYSLYGVDFSSTTIQLVGLLRSKVRLGEFVIAQKLAEYFELIIMLLDNRKNQKLSNDNYTVFLFDECIVHLDTLCQDYKKEIDKRLKSKAGKKYQNSPTKFHSEMKLFQEPILKQSGKLAKGLIRIIRKYFYVSGIGLTDRIETLITTLKSFIGDHILAEEFCIPIQKLISSLHYSGIMANLPSSILVKFIDLNLQIGWRNVFYLTNNKISTLNECLKGSFTSSAISLFPSIMNTNTGQNEIKFTSTVSNLTFPYNSSGKKAEEEIELRLKKKVKVPERVYFGYQKDTCHFMHEITMNMVNLFTHIDKRDKENILYYLLHIIRQEIEYESSPILCHSIMLAELVSWYAFTNAEREVPIIAHGNGARKLWVLNDTILDIEVEGNKARVELRNIIGHNMITYEIPSSLFRSQYLAKETKKHLNDLRANQEINIVSADFEELTIKPEHIINNFPCSLALRVNEKTLGWNPIEFNAELEQSLGLLDKIPAYNTHSIAILYISSFTNELIYSQSTWSEDFEVFLSNLGKLIDVRQTFEYIGSMPRDGSDGYYGIGWKDSLTQVFFHVSVLMQQVKEEIKEMAAMKIKKYVENDDIWIVWNESGSEVPEEFIKSKRTRIIIIVTPLANPYSVIQIAKVFIIENIEWSDIREEDNGDA